MTNDRKEIRHYMGAAGIFVLIVALLLFLSFVEIPPVNKDLFVAIVGTLVSSLGMVVYTIIGQQPDEVNKLQKKNESLTSINDQMETRNDQLEQMIKANNKKTEEKKEETKKEKKTAAPKTRQLWNGEKYVTVNI